MTEILKIEQMKRVDSSDDGDGRNGFLGLLGISCNQTSILSNSAEIVESKLSFKFTPLQLNRFGCYSLEEVSSKLEFQITLSSLVS